MLAHQATGDGYYREGVGPLAVSDDNGTNQIVAHTLWAEGFDASEDGTGRGTPIVAQAFNWQSGGDARGLELRDSASALHVGQVPAVFDPMSPTGHQGDTFVPVTGPAHCLPAGGGNNGGGGQVLGQTIPRRLTPMEAERLQAFPDGWTAYGTREDGIRWPMADGPRYRMLGNAVTVNVVEWIGRQIVSSSQHIGPE